MNTRATSKEIDTLALGETLGNLNGRMSGIEDTLNDQNKALKDQNDTLTSQDRRISAIEVRQDSNTKILERIDKNTKSSGDSTNVGKITIGQLASKILYLSIIGIGVAGVSLFVIWFLAKFIVFPNIGEIPVITGDSK